LPTAVASAAHVKAAGMAATRLMQIIQCRTVIMVHFSLYSGESQSDEVMSVRT
jgi:hypothetical protein